MERTRIKNNPSAILTSDWHLREDQPICRTDNYWEAQWKKVDAVSALQKRFNCPVLHGGDLFDHWKPSPNLLRETILHLPNQFYTIYGQHDLPQHNLELVHKCGINVLQAANKLEVLYGSSFGNLKTLCITGIPWGQEPSGFVLTVKKTYNILVWHKMNYKGQPPWPGCTDPSAIKLLKKYPQYDLILTGDNHKTFTQTYEGRVLVNPGSLMRMDADQEDHVPTVFLWYAESNLIVPVPLPHPRFVISREHIEQKKTRDNRIDAFVSRVDTDWEAKMSFEENLEMYKRKNKTKQSVINIIYKSIEKPS